MIEFNELSPVLLRTFIDDGKLPNFKRFHDTSDVFTTDARAAEPALEPWVQWPTVHYGVPHEVHGIRHLGDPSAQGRTPVAQVLSDAGVTVGVFGSMNVPYGQLNGFLVPDPWNKRSITSPAALAPYRHTVGVMVRESSRPDGAPPEAKLAAFGAFLLRNGLSARTIAFVGKQLIDERREPGLRWRRASALDWLQYDIFKRLSRRYDAKFTTFFSNSTAHYQHYYWRHMDPRSFTTPVDALDHASFEEAILYGYQSMDRLLGRFMADFPEAMLVLCTALSQEPWRDATKMTYRPLDFLAVLRLAGVPTKAVDVLPIMAEQFVLKFPGEEEAGDAKRHFAMLSVEGKALLRFKQEGSALIGGCDVNDQVKAGDVIDGAPDGSTPSFANFFYPIHTVRSGRHSPIGVLWFRTGQHVEHAEPVHLEDIAPTVLAHFGVAQPHQMIGEVLTLTAAVAASPTPAATDRSTTAP